ncbi:MAG: hypothetical protein ACR2OC_07635 [Solirubrobacterales bacterium]
MTKPIRLPRRAALLGATWLVLLLALSGTASTATALPPAPFDEFYGVSPATKLDLQETDRMGRAGAGTIRYPFYWPSIEPDPPVEDGGGGGGGGVPPVPVPLPTPAPESKQWKATDDLVGNAARAGIRVLPFVYGTPDWISPDPMRPPLDSEAARAAWQDLLTDLVRRYGHGGEFWAENPNVPKKPIDAWQLWNEVNSNVYWSPLPAPAEYADLMQISNAAIRAADPGAAIVLAGMFGTPANGIEAWTYLEGLYQSPGIAETFDAFGLHPYSPGLKGIRTQVGLARDVLERNGDKRLPLLISEIGWPTEGPADYNLVQTPDGQKKLLAKAFKLFLSERREWKIERVIWYTWRDNGVQPQCSVCSFSGLFTSRMEPKPAWRKFAQFAGGQP